MTVPAKSRAPRWWLRGDGAGARPTGALAAVIATAVDTISTRRPPRPGPTCALGPRRRRQAGGCGVTRRRRACRWRVAMADSPELVVNDPRDISLLDHSPTARVALGPRTPRRARPRPAPSIGRRCCCDTARSPALGAVQVRRRARTSGDEHRACGGRRGTGRRRTDYPGPSRRVPGAR